MSSLLVEAWFFLMTVAMSMVTPRGYRRRRPAVAVAAAGAPFAAAALVVRDGAVADRGARPGLDGEAAAQPVAAVAARPPLPPRATLCSRVLPLSVRTELSVRPSESVEADVDAAAQAVAAVGPGAAVTAHGPGCR